MIELEKCNTAVRRAHTLLVWLVIVLIIAAVPGAADYVDARAGREQRDRFITGLRQTKIATLIFSANAEENIIHANNKATALLKVGRYEIREMKATAFVPEKYRAVRELGFANWKSGSERNIPIRCEALAADGSLIPVSVDLWSVEVNGEILFVVELERQ